MNRVYILFHISLAALLIPTSVGLADHQDAFPTTNLSATAHQPMQDEYYCGDFDDNGLVDVLDIVYIWNYLITGGVLPAATGRGDIDGIKGISNNDVVFMSDYLFLGGPLWTECAPFPYDPIPPSRDTIRFMNRVVAPNTDTCTVEVWLSVVPDDTVIGLLIPFTFSCPSSAYIYCDNIDKSGGLFDMHGIFQTYIDTANNYGALVVGGPMGASDIVGPVSGLVFKARFSVEASPSGHTIEFTTATPYRGKLELSLRDGDPIAARPVVSGIEFEDIYAVEPYPHEVNASAGTDISVTFSEPMDISTIVESTFVVQGSMSGYHEPDYITYNSSLTYTAIHKPLEDFSPGEMVSVTVAPGIKVQGGSPLDNPRAWMFTVGSGGALGAFGTDTVYSAGSEPHCVYAGDFDNSGYVDFATANHNSNNVSVWLNDGAGRFTGYATYSVGSWPRSLSGGDFNKDGYLDLAVANYTSGNVTVLMNDGAGAFTPDGLYSAGSNPTSITVADFNNDGHQDLAVSNSADDNISVLLNNAGGGFDPQSTFPVGDRPYGVGAGDMDLDGDIDLAIANQDGNSISILLNDGAGSFSTDSVYSVSAELMSICVADLNNDLYPDLAVPSYTASEIGVLVNRGNGVFYTPDTYTVGSGANCVIAGDLNGDGFQDLTTANTNDNSISVLMSDGFAGFLPAENYAVDTGASWVTPFDYDLDGDLDLAVTNRLAGNVSILNNQSADLVVTNLDDAGDGSLRWAIGQANIVLGPDTISFDVSGTITPLSALPSLTDNSTTILGGSSPGGAHSVILDGSGAGLVHGLTLASDSNIIRDLTVYNWQGDCVNITGSYNTITGCHINVDETGSTRIAGSGDGHGIAIVAGLHNVVGGNQAQYRNVITESDGESAVYINNSDSNTIGGNYIGLSADGTGIGNPAASTRGVDLLNSDKNKIGNTESWANYIAGNQNIGISLLNSSGNFVNSNIIGLSATHQDTIPNSDGISLSGTCANNIIGPDNVIAGSSSNGISLNSSGVFGTSIVGNEIFGNDLNGIYLTGSSGNTIGGTLHFMRNDIFDNGLNGIHIYANSDSNVVIGNRIGVPFISSYQGNSGDGLAIDFNCDDNSVDSNLIADNGGDGVNVVINSLRNTITRNVFYGNGQLAIDLGDDGVTVNDSGDVDAGPNGLLNYPEIDSVFSQEAQEDESYMIYGRAIHDARVEFFVAHPADDSTRPEDPSGHGEAWIYVGQATASPAGEFAFHDTESEHFSLITCTATDSLGNTSEMSENFTLFPKPMIVTAYVYDPTKGTYLPQNGVNIIVEDPNGDRFGRDSLNVTIDEIPGDQYYAEGPSEDTVIIPDPIEGEYTVHIVGESGSETGTSYAAIIKTDGLQCAIVIDADTPASGTFDSYGYTYDETWDYDYVYGDANGDAVCNVADAVYIINYVFKGGPPPDPEGSGDADCDTTINVADAVYIINYVFKGGPEPCTVEQ